MSLDSRPNFLRNALNETAENTMQSIEAEQPRFANKQNRTLNKQGLFFLMTGLLLAAMSVYAGYQYYQTSQPAPVVTNNNPNAVEIPDFDSNRATALNVSNPEPETAQTPTPTMTEPSPTVVVEPPDTRVIEPPIAANPVITMPDVQPIYYPPVPPTSNALQPVDESAFFKDEFSDVKRGAVRQITNSETLLSKGTYIRCILETKIVSDIQGFASCVLPNPVYSLDGNTILLPKGSRVSGEYQSSGTLGNRVAVMWQRVITPNKLDVRLDSPGVDVNGSSGHVGKSKSHWLSRLGNTVMVSMISDVFKVAAQQYGPNTTVTNNNTIYQSPFESNTANGVNNFLNQTLTSTTNRPPTVTVNQGAVINIYVARDIDFANQREIVMRAR